MGECNTIRSAYTKYRHLEYVALTQWFEDDKVNVSEKQILSGMVR